MKDLSRNCPPYPSKIYWAFQLKETEHTQGKVNNMFETFFSGWIISASITCVAATLKNTSQYHFVTTTFWLKTKTSMNQST